MAEFRCSSSCSRSIRSPPRFSAEATSRSGLSRNDRARRLHLYDGFTARYAANPEHHPDDVLQNDDLGRADTRHDRGLIFLGLLTDSRRLAAFASGEGYGENHLNEPVIAIASGDVHPGIAILPLVIVGLANKALTLAIPAIYGQSSTSR